MAQHIPFMGRLKLAWSILINSELAANVDTALNERNVAASKPAKTEPPPERIHASGLVLLGALQREGRLIDFLGQDVAGFSDEEVGAAARVVHVGCSKVLTQFFEFEPAVK